MQKITGKHSERAAPPVLGSVLSLLPLLLAASTLPPAPWLFAAALALLWFPMQKAGVSLAIPALVFMQDVAQRHGSASIVGALVFVAIAGGLFYRRAERKTPPPAALYPAIALGSAVVVTLHHTAGYFATGSAGIGVPALLRSYRMLGFHPNWRTVLFSTVMMVVLITWPRKFKRLSRWLPAGFIGLVAVALLNLLLNPDPARPTVAETILRIPLSPLSMLLIFTAWDELPYARIKAIFKRPFTLGFALLIAVPAAMLLFDLAWVGLACIAVWGLYIYITWRRRHGPPLR